MNKREEQTDLQVPEDRVMRISSLPYLQVGHGKLLMRSAFRLT